MTGSFPRRIAEFDYELPEAHIAQTPSSPRDSARLLDATGTSIAHRRVDDLASLLGPGDLLVVNNTRVLPARLHLLKPTGGAAEVLLLVTVPIRVPVVVSPSYQLAIMPLLAVESNEYSVKS